jgi:hypothetical protein
MAAFAKEVLAVAKKSKVPDESQLLKGLRVGPLVLIPFPPRGLYRHAVV